MLEFLGERVLVVSKTTSVFLVFNDDGAEVLIAKTPIKVGMSWDSLHYDGVVFGNTVLEIDGSYYSVSLIRGGNSHVTVTDIHSGYNTKEHRGSEWNRYMYPIYSTTTTNNRNTSDMGTLAQYSDADLLVHVNYGKGSYSWCQEVSGMDSTTRVLRGHNGVTYGNYPAPSSAITYHGWRPLLTKLNIR